MSTETLDPTLAEERVFLKEPEGTRFFTQDREEIQIMLDHFNRVMQGIRTRAQHLGITIVAEDTGACTLAGDATAIASIVSDLRSEKLLLGH